jgi:tetratricopeptide (TPR) repeat protein
MHRRGADLSASQLGGGLVGIRVVPNEPQVPPAVYKYLLPHERRVITVRQHLAVLIPSASRAAGGLLAAAAVTPFRDSNVVEIVVWLVAGGLLVQLAAAIYGWLGGYMVVTNHRLMFFAAAILGGRAEQFPVQQAKRMEFKRSFGGRLLNYGSFVFEFDGYPQRIVEYLPYPEQLYLEVQGLIFDPPETEADGDDSLTTDTPRPGSPDTLRPGSRRRPLRPARRVFRLRRVQYLLLLRVFLDLLRVFLRPGKSRSSPPGERHETYRAMGRYDEALANLNRAIELDPEDARAIGSRGQTYRLMGRYDEALADFNRAIELDPDLGWAIANRGETFRAMGRYDEALADLNRAIELDPENDDYIMKRAEIQWHIGPAEPTVLQTAPCFTPASRPVAGQLADMCRRSADGSHAVPAPSCLRLSCLRRA